MIQEKKRNLLFLLKMMVLAYGVTAIMLFMLALLLYQFRLSARTVSVAVVIIYIGITTMTGFVMGKKIKIRKFLWGLVMGVLYFAILAVVSLLAGGDAVGSGTDFVTTFILCAAGGMLGGMLA